MIASAAYFGKYRRVASLNVSCMASNEIEGLILVVRFGELPAEDICYLRDSFFMDLSKYLRVQFFS